MMFFNFPRKLTCQIYSSMFNPQPYKKKSEGKKGRRRKRRTSEPNKLLSRYIFSVDWPQREKVQFLSMSLFEHSAWPQCGF